MRAYKMFFPWVIVLFFLSTNPIFAVNEQVSGGDSKPFSTFWNGEDVGISYLLSPEPQMQDCNTQNIQVSVGITNYGNNTVSGLLVSYCFANSTVVSEIITGSIPSGDTFEYTFTAGWNLPSAGIHTLQCWTALTGDSNPSNDTLTAEIHFLPSVSVLPYLLDFPPGTFYHPDIHFVLEHPDFKWLYRTVIGSDGVSGNAIYAPNWTFSFTGTATHFELPSFDLSNYTYPVLSFDLAYANLSYGPGLDRLIVSISTDGGQSFVPVYDKVHPELSTIATISHELVPTHANQWRKEIIDLTDFAGECVIIRFTDITFYMNHLYIDNISLDYHPDPPIAWFSPSKTLIYNGLVQFIDLSENYPQSWQWDFGDGNGSSLQHPVHTYSQPGVYTISLIAQNVNGSDTMVMEELVEYAELLPPYIPDTLFCLNGPQEIQSGMHTGTFEWFINDSLMHTGINFPNPNLSESTTIAYQYSTSDHHGFVGESLSNPGPVNFVSYDLYCLNFVAHSELTIVSAVFRANSWGNRIFYLWDSLNTMGNIIDSVEIFIPIGENRYQLNFEVPGPGSYSIGGIIHQLAYLPNTANYPYILPGLLEITDSYHISASSSYYGLEFGGNSYFLFYDMEVKSEVLHADFADLDVDISFADFTYEINGSSVDFTNLSEGANSYWWSFGNGTYSSAVNPQVVYAANGEYEVILWTDSYCSFSEIISIPELEDEIPDGYFGTRVFPNPCKDFFQICFDRASLNNIRLELFNSMGELVYTDGILPGSSHLVVSTQSFPAGVYYLVLKENTFSEEIKLLFIR